MCFWSHRLRAPRAAARAPPSSLAFARHASSARELCWLRRRRNTASMARSRSTTPST